jgi:hypothetical protein
VFNFTPRPLYHRGKRPRYPLDRRLGGPQSRSGRFGEEKILDPTGTRTPTPFFIIIISGRWSPYWVHAALRPLLGLLYLSRVIVTMMVLAGKTEVLGENLPQRHFVHHKCHLPDPGRRGGKPATNRFSYGAAISDPLAVQAVASRYTD